MIKRIQKPFFKLIGGQILEYKHYYGAAVICIIATNYFQSELPFYAKELGDLVVNQQLDQVPYHVYILVALGIILFRTLSRVLFFYPARILQGHMMGELIDLLESSNPYRFKEFTSGQLYQTLQVDIQAMRGFVGFALLQVANVFIALAILLPKIASFNSELVIAFTPLVVSVVLFAFITYHTQIYFRKIQDLQGEVQNFIIESYEGKKTIKNFHSEKSFFHLFEGHCKEELKMFFRATLGPATSTPLIKLGVGISFIWGAHIIINNELGATSIILFSGFVYLLLSPLLFISWIGAISARTWGSWQRIQELLTSLAQKSNTESLLEKDNKNWKNLNEPINLRLWDNLIKINLSDIKSLVLVGETGVGKSYLLQQLASLFVDRGINANMIFQEPYLFNDTIFANLFLGKEPSEQDKEEGRKLLKLFGLDALEEVGKDLYELEIGENGKRISGGQAKRIALIRSLLADSDVIIWDDPFSSVDLILENQIFRELRSNKYFKDKLLIFSSHRLSSVRQSEFCMLLTKSGETVNGKIPEILEQENSISEFFKQQMV